MVMTLMPPAQYDHAPSVTVIEHVLPAAEVDRLCHTRKGAPAGLLTGCSVRNGNDGKCYIVHIGDKDIRRHEIAHCNGWPHDHPGGWWDVTQPGVRDR
jgi:hypothetical protein